MGKMLIKVTNLDSGKIKYIDDFYFFEERGIRNLEEDGKCKDFVGNNLKIEFVSVKEVE